MKFRKTLACVAAAAVAASSMAVTSFAEYVIPSESGQNLSIDMARLLPDGVDISEVYGLRANFTDASAEVLMNGAGGGFIFSTASNNWNQLQWCNGCTPGEDDDPNTWADEHNIQWDPETNSITRMETTPFFTAEDISGAEGTYGQVAFSKWWGGDLAFESFDLLDAEGNVLTATPGEEENPSEDGSDSEVNPGETTETPEVNPGETTETPDEPETPDKPETPDEPETPGDPVKEVKKEVTIANGGKTVIDSELVRTNIINNWAGDDACVIADAAEFEGARTITVYFEVTDFTEEFDAWISFASNNWGVSYWGEGNEDNAKANGANVKVTGNGTYAVSVTTDEAITAMDFIAVCTNLTGVDADEDGIADNVTITITKIETNTIADVNAASGKITTGDDATSDDDTNLGDSSGETNVPTGVALTVVPVAFAAAALATAGVVLKKKSK